MVTIEPSSNTATHREGAYTPPDARACISVDVDESLDLFPAEDPQPASRAAGESHAASESGATGASLFAVVAAGEPAAQPIHSHIRVKHQPRRIHHLAVAVKRHLHSARNAIVRTERLVEQRFHHLAVALQRRLNSGHKAIAVGVSRLRTEQPVGRRFHHLGAAVKTRLEFASRVIVVAVSRVRREQLVALAMFVAIAAAARYTVLQPMSSGGAPAEPELLTAAAWTSWIDLRPAVSEMRTPRSAVSEPQRPAEVQRIQRVLNRYRDAFSVLDARGAKSVWPAVDAGALAARFARVIHQNYEFDSCGITVGQEDAVANCRGLVEYQPIGSGAVRREARAWHFSLRKIQDDWFIEAVDPQ